jgi:hypothetical protein
VSARSVIATALCGRSMPLTSRAKRSQITLSSAAERGVIPRFEWPEWERTKMKLPVTMIVISSTALLLNPSSGFSQQQQIGSAAATTTNSGNQQTQPFQPFLPPPTSTIRVMGGPTIQPSRD